MNFKERGVTVGDLLIILIITISSILIINKANENDKRAYLHINSNLVSKIMN